MRVPWWPLRERREQRIGVLIHGIGSNGIGDCGVAELIAHVHRVRGDGAKLSGLVCNGLDVGAAGLTQACAHADDVVAALLQPRDQHRRVNAAGVREHYLLLLGVRHDCPLSGLGLCPMYMSSSGYAAGDSWDTWICALDSLHVGTVVSRSLWGADDRVTGGPLLSCATELVNEMLELSAACLIGGDDHDGVVTCERANHIR